ncbi:MAG TPA: hypothetical protein VJM34_00020 [Novosphingobium sp.]|nr:hypothetical protein [Novosphingobium sp.]
MNQLSMIDQMRVWAALTGLVLTALFFGALYLSFEMKQTLPMLVTGIGGFELFLYAQDLVRRRKARNG